MMLTRLLILALVASTVAISAMPTASAINGCEAVTDRSCPGLVCYGTGGVYGYAACVGSNPFIVCVQEPCGPWPPQ